MVHGIRRDRPILQYLAKVTLSLPRLNPENSIVANHAPQFSTLHVLEVRKQRSESTETPLYGLVPFFITWTFVPLYLYLQPIILNYHLIPFVFYVGLINAYSVGQIIIAHLTKSPKFPYQNILTIPLALAVLDSLGPILGLWPSALGDGTYQIAFVFLCAGLAVGVYGSFVVSTSLWSNG